MVSRRLLTMLLTVPFTLACQTKAPSQEGSKTALSKVKATTKPALAKKNESEPMTPAKGSPQDTAQVEIARRKGAELSALSGTASGDTVPGDPAARYRAL